ncbi:MAG: hypothetical protein IT204_15730 [Fimbriimonadaceae bacterium]|nr:hypothetical protein [Fimbriimonadaceae bacterium]
MNAKVVIRSTRSRATVLLTGWLLLLPTIALAAGNEQPDRALAWLPQIRAQQTFSATGVAFNGWSYEGQDLLLGRGAMQMRYAQRQTMFGDRQPGQSGLWAGSTQTAYSLGYTTDAKQQGLQLGFNLVDIDRDFADSGNLGFAAELAGKRQQDYRLGWRQGQLGFELGRDRLIDKENRAGLARDVLKLGAYGFTYQREGLRIDEDAQFGGALTGRLLGAQGYNLTARKLGDAKAGYASLDDLAGLRDDFESYGFSHGDLAVGFYERRLALGEQTLLDRAQSLRFGALQVRQSTRTMDAGFGAFRQTGYTDWQRFAGGREDQTSANLNLGYLAAGWTDTRFYSNPKGQEGKGVLTQTQEQKLLLQPVKEVALSYRRNTSRSGNEKLFDEAPDKLTRSDDLTYGLGTTFGQHKLNWTLRTFEVVKPGLSSGGREQSLAYTFGKRTTLRYSDRRESRIATTDDETTTTVARMQTMSAETAFGLSALHERVSGPDVEPGTHDRVRFDRRFGARYEVNLGYESWEQMAAPKLALAGYAGMLAKPVEDAVLWDVAATVRPGTTTISAWHRSLEWEQAAATPQFAAGEHKLTETGVSVTQAISGEFGLRGKWSRYDKDDETDLERREVALTVKAAKPLPFLPTAELGYRELKGADGKTRPAMFVAASLKPAGSLELKAQLAQTQSAGAQAVVQDWYEVDRRSFTVGATQRFGQGGTATLAYSELPSAPRAALGEGDAVQRARDLAVEMSLPSDWLLKGMQVKGKYHRLRTPGYGQEQSEKLEEHEASLIWKPGKSEELSATWRLRSTRRGETRNGNSRLELNYTKALTGGRLALTGFYQDRFDDLADWDTEEQYRVGFTYTMPF